MPSNGEKKVVQDNRGRFAPGNKSGGRHKVDPEVRKILEASAPDAAKLLAETIRDDSARLDLRIKAAEILFDRVYGKPPQAVDLDANVKSAPKIVKFVGDLDAWSK